MVSTSPSSGSAEFRALRDLPEWQAFESAATQSPIHVHRLRILSAAGLDVDISGQGSSPELAQATRALLEARRFTAMREQLLDGGIVNITEHRAAWHTALRAPDPVDEIAIERQRLTEFVRQADSERRWRNIVHIGIGGSDWGVRLAVNAFGYAGAWRTVHFVANIDGHAMQGGLSGFDPHDTLIVMASKSFTTAETLQNGTRALEWLQAAGIQNPYDQVVAVTARADVAEKWGIPKSHIFRLWDWVGGRFSLWSSVSLTTALAVDTDVVAGMQAGAAAMDTHFAEAPLEDNAPVQMAISGIVNRSVLGYGSLNIAPYDFRLAELVPYLQQLEMESLGKSVDVSGAPVGVPTGPAVWGMPGTDAQHTFFQWLHQGSDGAPVDFIVCRHADHGWPAHHQSLLANCLAQREALLKGKTYEEALQQCLDSGMAPDQAKWLAHHKVHAGGRPSNLIVLPRLSPYALGALLALYEHKIFVQGLVWGINPFDQWGVEYGKVLAQGIASELAGTSPVDPNHDASTAHWVNLLATSKEAT
ncbi:glucose-6-phosphate isomerase [Allopusillimonas ginsengisoli]|uniref:glucose-6-phosphate isomerase n=1 Tax=Allopusillimonas ginsengisoli TaxID=453575 RepID=UPI0010204DF8|nr:glucose-6-phosphate isomerase [Allopusillimonas ginsengisoli]TEA77883.1 glucose-6-phosphate isomerase [Allopusillimonas ginsengisoli]